LKPTANFALENLHKRGCQTFVHSSTDLAIAAQSGARLLDLRLLPEKEANDGKILAQASLVAIPPSVTSDRHPPDTDEALLLAFNEADLIPVHPFHPRRLLKALR
jgi:hypothetical protein